MNSRLQSRIQWLIAHIDLLINAQLNAILAHPRLQKLEASWRQLQQLIVDTAPADNVKVRVINFSWHEIARDVENASDFDGSYLFKLIYSNEFDTPGGEPYGLLLGDYNITPFRKDLGILRLVGQIASAAFAPLIVGITADFFELDGFSQLHVPINLLRTFSQDKYKVWKTLQTDIDMRFVGLVLPRVLVKRGHRDRDDHGGSRLGYHMRECYLWGNPCFAFATVAINTFKASGWFAGIQGLDNTANPSAVLEHLSRDSFMTYDDAPLQKISTEVYISEQYERELNELGFIALCECRYTNCHAFYSSPSIYLQSKSVGEDESINSSRSSMLNYVMCVSRFAHYIKVIARDKIGSYKTAEACEAELSQWILNYTANSSDMSSELMAKHPLRSAAITIKERKQAPGNYYMTIRLQPHYQFEWESGAVELLTDLKHA